VPVSARSTTNLAAGVKVWRSEMVRHLVFGTSSESAKEMDASTMAS
jgi:hypothetical protein